MERVFWVKNGELQEVNSWLQKGGRVKLIQAASEAISSYGYHATGGLMNNEKHGNCVGDIYAYIVIEFD